MLFLFAILQTTMANEKPFLTFVDPADAIAPQQESLVREPGNTLDVTDYAHEQSVAAETPKPVVRTYHQDMYHIMGTNDPRTMSTLLQEVRHEEAVKASTTLVSPKNRILLLASVLCIIVGIAALGFVFYRNYATTRALQEGQSLSLIQAETHTNVTLANNELFKNRERIQLGLQVSLPLETINHLFFTQETLSGLSRLGFSQVIEQTGGAVPASLAETLDEQFMYGVYRSSQMLPFLILRVNDYDDAFEGMRTWEPLMLNHLGFLFQLPDALQTTITKTVFTDAIIANRTVRIARYVPATPLPAATTLSETAEGLASEQPEQMPADDQATIETPVVSGDNATVLAESTTDALPSEDNTVAETTPPVPSETPTEALLMVDPAPEIPAAPAAAPVQETPLPYEEGDTILMYTFLNERTILITTSESVLQEILFRLTNAQLLL